MLTEQEKKELYRKFSEKQKEVNDLRRELNVLDEQKESWFTKKEAIGKEIRDLINEVREHKNSRNSLTNQVKEAKKGRDVLNSRIKEAVDRIKVFKKEESDISKKYDIKGNPAAIKAEIDKIEQQIQENVMSFDKEKELMKRIRELKKQFGDAKQVSDVWDKIHTLSKEIDGLKKEAEDIHRKIQNMARQSQEKHEGMVAKSKQIDELKVKEEEAYKKFFELKTKFTEVNNKLKERLGEMKDANEKVGEFKEESREERRKTDERKLRSLEGEVEQKIRRGEKLTTEDLLILQGAQK